MFLSGSIRKCIPGIWRLAIPQHLEENTNFSITGTGVIYGPWHLLMGFKMPIIMRSTCWRGVRSTALSGERLATFAVISGLIFQTNVPIRLSLLFLSSITGLTCSSHLPCSTMSPLLFGFYLAPPVFTCCILIIHFLLNHNSPISCSLSWHYDSSMLSHHLLGMGPALYHCPKSWQFVPCSPHQAEGVGASRFASSHLHISPYLA